MKSESSHLQPPTLSSRVFNSMKDAIFTGQFIPGEALKEMHLARAFNVSQATIREALIHLEKYGLIEKVPHKGARVVDKSNEELKELIMIRYQLEELAAILASQKMDQKEISHLRSIDRKIQHAVRKNQYFELILHDIDFHKYIWDQSGNANLAIILERITVPLFAAISIRRSKQEQALQKAVISHQRIISALSCKEIDDIKLAYQTDLNESYGIFIQEIKSSENLAYDTLAQHL